MELYYVRGESRVILWKWNFVFVLAKLKDLCVLDIIYDHDDIYEMNPHA